MPDTEKNELQPHLKKCWCIPPKENASFVAATEDAPEVYGREYDVDRPVVCMDEKPVRLLDDVRTAFPMKPGRPERCDNEYVRKGTASISLFTEPLSGRRRANSRERRTRRDWAEEVRRLLDEGHPHAEKVVLVLDNLNTHGTASLYETFEPEEALRLAQRLEIHHAPKHGSWLNIAEIEISALGRQCLGRRRIGTLEELNKEPAAWRTTGTRDRRAWTGGSPPRMPA